jgi:hypothetical protein
MRANASRHRDCRAVLARVKATRFAGALKRDLDPRAARRSSEDGRGGETALSTELGNGAAWSWRME